jgi:aryl carrier-like protein
VGDTAETLAAAHPDALPLMGVGHPIPNTAVRFTDEARRPLADGTVGHLEIRGPNVTAGYFQLPAVNAQVITADGWLDTGDLGLYHDGEVIITGRAKEIIFVNGQNYYPHDLENIAIRAPGLELGKVVAAAARPAGAVARLVNEHAGLEVAHVVPVKRIPKTTSGKLQRGLLAQDYVDGAFTADITELVTLRVQRDAAAATAAEAARGPGAGLASTAMEQRLKNVVDTAMAPKAVGLDDNLFEVGASSLVLIQIHEEIDRDHPGVVDLTELFDHPTIRALAAHLEHKLA